MALRRINGLKLLICSSRQRLQLHSGIVRLVVGQIAAGRSILDTLHGN
jgi:hypothetical protein